MLKKKYPPGKIKIMEALSRLLSNKEFSVVTTAEIASEATVTEGLIYKYFDDKQDLLFQVLTDLFSSVIETINQDLMHVEGTIGRFRAFIHSSVKSYANNRVFSKIILLEVRKSPRFFSSPAYGLVREYSALFKTILQSGIESGSLRQDINIHHISEVVFGAIEHSCLHGIIFNKPIDVEKITDNLCDTIFKGISSYK